MSKDKQTAGSVGYSDESAHLDARELLLETANRLARVSRDSETQVFASAVREYLRAEVLEPCLHLHSGAHVGPCPTARGQRS